MIIDIAKALLAYDTGIEKEDIRETRSFLRGEGKFHYGITDNIIGDLGEPEYLEELDIKVTVIHIEKERNEGELFIGLDNENNMFMGILSDRVATRNLLHTGNKITATGLYLGKIRYAEDREAMMTLVKISKKVGDVLAEVRMHGDKDLERILYKIY